MVEACVTLLAGVINLLVLLLIIDSKYKFLINLSMITSIILGIVYSVFPSFPNTTMDVLLLVSYVMGTISYIIFLYYIILSIFKVQME